MEHILKQFATLKNKEKRRKKEHIKDKYKKSDTVKIRKYETRNILELS